MSQNQVPPDFFSLWETRSLSPRESASFSGFLGVTSLSLERVSALPFFCHSASRFKFCPRGSACSHNPVIAPSSAAVTS